MKVLQILMIYSLPLVLAVYGSLRYEKGTHYPTYTNVAAVEKLFESDYRDSDKYYKDVAKYETPRNQLMDSGAGFAALGLSGIALLLFFRVTKLADIAAIKSPSSLLIFFILMNLTLFLEGLAEIEYLQRTQERGDYPPWADSVGIGIVGVIIALSFQALVLNAYVALIRKRCSFPARLFQRKPVVLIDWLVAVAVADVVYSLINSVFDGAFLMVPLELIVIYLALALRSVYREPEKPAQPELSGRSDS